MNTFVRWLIGLLFILALSIFLLILTLPVLVNPNDYKNRITNLVREKTGRELVIHGNIQLQISSWLNVTCALGKTRLGGNARFANSPFLESEQTKIELSLWPLLLQRQLHMTSIMLNDVTLNLLRNKEGVSNWEHLPNQAAPAADAAATQETAVLAGDRIQTLLARLFLGVTGLDIGRLQLSNVTVRYDNRQYDRIIILHNLKIKTGRLREKIPFPFEADCDLTLDHRTGGKPSIIRSGDIAVQGNATLFLQDPHLLLEDLRLDGAVKGKNLPKRGLKFTLATNSDLHLQQQKITIKDFSLNHEGAILQGNGVLEDFSSPRFTISLKIPDFSPQTLLKQLKPSLPLWHNADALTHLRAEMQVKGNMEESEITELAITVDETTATGTIKIKDLLHPDYEAFLQVDHLDLDRYTRKKTVPPLVSQELESTSVADSEQKEASPPIIPVRFFKALPFQLDLHVESLKIDGAKVSQAQIKVDSKEGVVQMAPLTANLYGGTLNLEARIDVTGDIPQVQVKSKITKVQLAALRQDMTGTKDVTGMALIQAEINTSGLSRKDLLSHMNGTLRVELVNGEITPLTILPVIRTSLKPEQTTTPVMTEEGTRFTRLSGSGIMEDGILHTDDLVATSEIMQITGAGEIDFDHQQTDFILNITLSPDLDQHTDLGMTGMGGKLVPYKIFGPFTALRQEADVEGLLPTETETQPVKELSVDESLKESIPEANSSESAPELKGQEPEGE